MIYALRPCQSEGCDREVVSKGLCSKHYQRARFGVTPRSDRKTGPHPVPTFAPIDGKCGVEDCGRELKQRGLCTLHYGRLYHYGAIGDAKPTQKCATRVPCAVEGCGKPARGKGYCATHYRRVQATGHAGGAELKVAARGSGSITDAGYRVISVDGRTVLEHRHIMAQKLGRPLRKGENVHHMDGDKLNNHPDNLELWSVAQPSGQRVRDKVRAAIAMIREHPEIAREMGARLLTLESQESTDVLADELRLFGSITNAVLGFGA